MTLKSRRPFDRTPERVGPPLVLVAVRDARDLPLIRMGCQLAAAREGNVEVLTVSPSGDRPPWLSLPEPCADGPEVELVVREGRDISAQILEEVRKSHTDTLILGWKGELSRGRYWLGRTLDPLIQGAPSQVVLVNSEGLGQINRILIPVAGGPNAPQAFELARAIAPDANITALYVTRPHAGRAELLAGQDHAESVLELLSDRSHISTRIVRAEDPVTGILEEAKRGYDLLLLGAGGEDVMDRFLFGNISQGVLAGSPIPTAVVRRPLTSLSSFQRQIWMRIFRFGPTLTLQEQAQVYKGVRRGVRPTTDFWMMIALASALASLGLLLNSPAIIIGAMLVAPLMTAILGMGLSIVVGDPKFFWRALTTTIGGAALAVFVGFLVTLAVPGSVVTPEVLARTTPTLLDLAVALAAGSAAAYAMCRRDVSAALAGVAIAAALAPPLTVIGIGLALQEFRVAGGATLLFVTNIIGIVAAGGIFFLWLGFHPQPGDLDRAVVLRRGFWSVGVLLLLLSIPLGLLTATSTRRARLENAIQSALVSGLRGRPGADLVAWAIIEDETPDDTLRLDVTLRVVVPLTYEEARGLQENVAARLERSVALSLSMVPTTRLRAYTPPTPTPTPPPTPTGALSPTPTASPTATATPSLPPTATPTLSPSPTATLPPSPTPWMLTVTNAGARGVHVRYSPNGLILTTLSEGTPVRVLEGPVVFGGASWYRIYVEDARLEGWMAADYLGPAP